MALDLASEVATPHYGPNPRHDSHRMFRLGGLLPSNGDEQEGRLAPTKDLETSPPNTGC